MLLRSLFPAALLLFSQLVWCDEGDHYNRVVFQSEASRKVNNDLLTARMSVEINDKQAGRIAQKLNATLNEALKTAGPFSTVKIFTGDQNTVAIYGKNNHFIGYRGHAELRLESRDFDAAAKLIAQLQEKMQLAEIGFSIAPETQKQVENALIAEAIDAFRKRAEAVRGMLNGGAYKLVRLNITQGGSDHALSNNYRARMLADQAVPVSVQKLSGGQSEISVQVAGTIEILP